MDHLILSRTIQIVQYEPIKAEIQIYRSDGEDMDDFHDRGINLLTELMDKLVESITIKNDKLSDYEAKNFSESI